MTGGFFKIVHERFRAKNSDEQIEAQVRQMQEIVKSYPELKSNIQRSVVSTKLTLVIPNPFNSNLLELFPQCRNY